MEGKKQHSERGGKNMGNITKAVEKLLENSFAIFHFGAAIWRAGKFNANLKCCRW